MIFVNLDIRRLIKDPKISNEIPLKSKYGKKEAVKSGDYEF